MNNTELVQSYRQQINNTINQFNLQLFWNMYNRWGNVNTQTHANINVQSHYLIYYISSFQSEGSGDEPQWNGAQRQDPEVSLQSFHNNVIHKMIRNPLDSRRAQEEELLCSLYLTEH